MASDMNANLNLDEVKREAISGALADQIVNRFNRVANELSENFREGRRVVNIKKKVGIARTLLAEVESLLAEAQKYDPNHS